MSDSNDKLLDENLTRLLADRHGPPVMSTEVEAKMLAQLQAKQTELLDQTSQHTPRAGTDADHLRGDTATLNEETTMAPAIAQPAVVELRERSASHPTDMRVVGMRVTGVLLLAVLLLLAIVLAPPQGNSPRDIEPLAPIVPAAVEATEVAREVLTDGSVVIAHRGSKYSVTGERRIRLQEGDIYLIVAKSREPFVVTTDDGEVRATGTRFAVSTNAVSTNAVSTNADKRTSAAVAQGRVILANQRGDVELRAGQRGVLRRGERPTREPAPRLSHVVSWAKAALAQEQRLVAAREKQEGLIALDPWGQETKLTLRKYHVDVHIEDGIARTTIDQTFFNHYPWNSEGTFYFPLPPDASVSRLAMYVAGKLNEGGMVERSYGQEVYNDIRYQRRDPALLEMMEGNVFKMRIFPLEGRQEKRIFLSYTQSVEELYGTQRYWFPMDHTHTLAKQLSIRVRVKNGAARYQPRSSTHELTVNTDGDDLVLEYNQGKARPNQDFLLHLVPAGELAGTRVTSCEKDGQQFVFGRFTPKLPGEVRTKPRQWILLNDTSASRTKIETEAQRYIAERLTQEADDDDSLVIVHLNTQADIANAGTLVPVKSLRNAKASRSFVLQDLWPEGKRVGATNMQAGIDAVARLIKEHRLSNPHVLYLGDGVATDGTTEVVSLVRSIPKSATFIGIGVGKKVDARFLQAAADQTGGMFTTINPDEDIDWRVFDLIAALNTPRLTAIKVSLRNARGKKIDAIAYPSSRTLAAGETLSVVARCARQPATLTVTGKLNGKKWRVQTSLDKAQPQAEYIPRFWAKRHLDELLKSGPEHKDEIVRLSKQYYVVTPHTSLIVLEDDAMYAKYQVERGRKDHWALYPAPKEIPVVKEPLNDRRWAWWGNLQGEDAKIKATTRPKSVQELVDSVQFRINAPFYFHQPPRSSQSRLALYQLLDTKADPSRLLRYAFAAAAGDEQTIQALQKQNSTAGLNGQEQGGDARGPTVQSIRAKKAALFGSYFALPSWSQFDSGLPPRMMQFQDSFFLAGRGEIALPEFLPMQDAFLVDEDTVLPFFLGEQRAPMMHNAFLDDARSMLLPTGFSLGKRLAPPQMLMLPAVKRKRLPEPMMLSGSFGYSSSSADVPPQLLRAYQDALGKRWGRINRDIRQFNRQYGRWNFGWTQWGGQQSLDLSQNTNWYGGLNELLEESAEDDEEEMQRLSSLLNFRQGLSQPGEVFLSRSPPRVAIATLGAYERTLQTQPGTCSVLAADHLVSRRAELLEKPLTPDGQKELESIDRALANVEKAASRIEDSGPFWSHEGWSYRPQPWAFQQPTVQAYPRYNWSFDLTRYTTALYSNSADVLDAVMQQFGGGDEQETGKVDEAARRMLDEARQAIQTASIRYTDDGPEILVSRGDRFAFSRRTNMYLGERMVCDGENVFHLYEELGLASRRPATEARLSSLRQLAPHLVEPGAVLAKQFHVELASREDAGFKLKLTPLGQTDESDDPFHLTMFVAHDGRIRSKELFVNGEKQLRLAYEYTGTQVAARWFDKFEPDAEPLAEFTYTAAILPGDASDPFAADLSGYVVFDMPLRKASYYAEQSAGAGGQDVQRKINLKRHQALACIQDLQARRWGQTNQEAVRLLNEAFVLMKQAGQKAKLGDLTLLGSAGVYRASRAISGEKAYRETHPVARYFEKRHQWEQDPKLRDDHPDTLVGHMVAYHSAVRQHTVTDDYRYFLQHYVDSPLLLAATYFCSSHGQQPDAWFELYSKPRWRGGALLMSAHSLQTDEHRRRFASAFDKWRREMSEAGYEVPITVLAAQQLKSQEVWQTIVADRFERAKESKRIGPLLRFAEDALNWGEEERADQTLKLARKRLKKQGSLLGDLALAQALWAGNRPQDALRLYNVILAALEEKGIAASPALLASAARLAQQAGDHSRAIELEERALAGEHRHLPEMINLQAFRQRYSWLWQQYEAQLRDAVAADNQTAIDDLLVRAEAAWQRWYEIDHANFNMFQQMATFQATAGRKAAAWRYLSTAIDLQPKDANSYSTVSQWHVGRQDLDEAEKWLARAYQWDTANPRWLVERGQLLDRIGRKQDAREVYQQVITGKWSSGLQAYVEQARKALSQ